MDSSNSQFLRLDKSAGPIADHIFPIGRALTQFYCFPMTSQRGVALILALLVLAFLTVLGGALLTTSTIDILVSDNYKTAVQSLYLAEAGIDEGRELLRASTNSINQLLTTAAGPNAVLSNATDLATLLASDDQPLVPSAPSLRTIGQALTDSSGQIIGRYHLWLRNDNADLKSSRIDSNQVLTLLSVGTTGNAEKVIEVTVRKAGIALDDPALTTPAGLEEVVTRITAHATDVYSPPPQIPLTLGNYGSPANYRVLVVNGDVNLGWGTGYGILLARGDVNVTGSFEWNGLIFMIGDGTLHWDTDEGRINGGFFPEPGDEISSRIHPDQDAIAAANRPFPYVPIAINER